MTDDLYSKPALSSHWNVHANTTTTSFRTAPGSPSSRHSKPHAKSLLWNILRITPYSGIFCRPSRLQVPSKSNGFNILSARYIKKSSPATAAAFTLGSNNSLFWNILRISPYSRIFCEPKPSSCHSKYNESNILAIRYRLFSIAGSISIHSCLSTSPAPASHWQSGTLRRLPDFLRLSTMNVYPHRWALPRNL